MRYVSQREAASCYLASQPFFPANDTALPPVNRDMAALRLILNYAKRQQYLDRNPVCDVSFLKEPEGNMRIVSHWEQRMYLAAASPLVHDVALLVVETGMRPGEVFHLEVEDVFLRHSYLKVQKGKTRLARRTLQLTQAAYEMLKQRLAKAKGRFLYPHRCDPNRPLDNIHRGHYKAVRGAGIKPEFRLYDFRHTFGSRSAMAGVDLPTLKELMGHINIKTTMRYVHPTPEHKRQAMGKLKQFNLEQALLAQAHTAQIEGSLQKSLQ
jgi:integrase